MGGHSITPFKPAADTLFRQGQSVTFSWILCQPASLSSHHRQDRYKFNVKSNWAPLVQLCGGIGLQCGGLNTSCDMHLDLLHSERRNTHTHTHGKVLSAGLSGIRCESTHNVPEHESPRSSSFSNTPRQHFSSGGASERPSGEDSPGQKRCLLLLNKICCTVCVCSHVGFLAKGSRREDGLKYDPYDNIRRNNSHSILSTLSKKKKEVCKHTVKSQ